MNQFPLNIFIPDASRIVTGCMGLGGSWDDNPISKDDVQKAHELVDTALDCGINLFDHADIYTRGKAEQVFGQVFAERPELRRDIIIQTKCGIRFEESGVPKRYDFSKEWINTSVENSLKRLNTDYLDLLLLHRPDPLMEPAEVAEAFMELLKAGKVRHFGVSNMTRQQIKYLQSYLDVPIIVNQIEMSLSRLDWLNESVVFNHPDSASLAFPSGTIEYCRTHDIQLQAWGCLSKGLFSGKDVRNESAVVQATAQLVARMAEEMNVSREAVVLAWLMRHPVGIQPVIGTTNKQRIQACQQAESIELSREQWYKLFETARGQRLP